MRGANEEDIEGLELRHFGSFKMKGFYEESYKDDNF